MWRTGKQRNVNRREVNSHTDRRQSLGKVARNEKFIIPETPVGSFDRVLRRSQFRFRIGVNAGI